MGEIEEAPDPDDFPMGMPASAITTTVDVGDFVAQKRGPVQGLKRRKIHEDSFFPSDSTPNAFREAFGYEWFIPPWPPAPQPQRPGTIRHS